MTDSPNTRPRRCELSGGPCDGMTLVRRPERAIRTSVNGEALLYRQDRDGATSYHYVPACEIHGPDAVAVHPDGSHTCGRCYVASYPR